MTAAVKSEFDRGCADYMACHYRDLATNKLVLGAGAATVAVGAAGTYWYLKNRQKPLEAAVQETQEVNASTVTVEGSPELTITALADGKALLKHKDFASTITYDVNAVNAQEIAIAELSLAIGKETE